MARLRTIKPGFFVDEELGDCQPLARILFAALWTIADLEGRLEDRPRRIKVECLPYDDCDADQLLGELATHDFIIRYTVDGKHFIAIPTWHKHQRPHPREAASIFPAPSGCTQGTTKVAPEHNQGDDEPGGVLDPGMGSDVWDSRILRPTASRRPHRKSLRQMNQIGRNAPTWF